MAGKYIIDSLKLETVETLVIDETFLNFNNSNWPNSESNLTFEEQNSIIKKSFVDQKFGDGYISLSIVYIVFCISNFVAPGVVSVVGHKTTMFFAAASYLLYILSYLSPTPGFIYTASALNGLGAAFLWTAQGDFLHHQSGTEKLMARNTGIFWCIFQCSLLCGNIYIIFAWKGKKYVDTEMRTQIFTIFAILGAAGCGLLLTLKSQLCGLENRFKTKNEIESSKIRDFLNSVKNSFKLLFTKKMLFFAPLILFDGFFLGFYTGVYPTTVGNSKNLENASAAVGLCGLMTGVGGIIGGGIFVFGSKLLNRFSRVAIIFGNSILMITAMLLTLFNHPFSANIAATEEKPKVFGEVKRALVLFISFANGFCDAVYKNVIFSSITEGFEGQTSYAFALRQTPDHAQFAFS
ncbi:unnamed protein product [Oikopleura dioica]|uniref:UNC93-like protein MFSD11 n=1 Tax=Oikopleura dioica TaxID=34765 RepID=E4WTL5_OIKDI|nr:unnamed protein product [Oikopleura dioica]